MQSGLLISRTATGKPASQIRSMHEVLHLIHHCSLIGKIAKFAGQTVHDLRHMDTSRIFPSLILLWAAAILVDSVQSGQETVRKGIMCALCGMHQ